MTPEQLTVETVPATASIHAPASGRADLSFGIRNDSACALELVAVEQDARAVDGSLLQRRIVDKATRIRPQELQTIPDPLPEAVLDDVATLVYTFRFLGGADTLLYVTVTVESNETRKQCAPRPTPRPPARQGHG